MVVVTARVGCYLYVKNKKKLTARTCGCSEVLGGIVPCDAILHLATFLSKNFGAANLDYFLGSVRAQCKIAGSFSTPGKPSDEKKDWRLQYILSKKQ